MDDALAFLAERPIGVMATVGADGMPHAVPCEVVVSDGLVYGWCERSAVRARNVERTARAALTAYKGNSFVLVRGPARLLDVHAAGYTDLTAMFLKKYDRIEAFGNDTLIEITPERVSARL
ncbi:MAG: pyridoxamine 5'-phosphate oxidase family protein [Actinomycetota bacterium]